MYTKGTHTPCSGCDSHLNGPNRSSLLQELLNRKVLVWGGDPVHPLKRGPSYHGLCLSFFPGSIHIQIDHIGWSWDCTRVTQGTVKRAPSEFDDSMLGVIGCVLRLTRRTWTELR